MAEGDQGGGQQGGQQQGGQQQQTPWHTGVDAEVLGHWQNKGIKLDDPKFVAIEMTKAARAAQALVGAPPEQILRLPSDVKDEAGWKGVWGRLGAPGDAKDYDFSGIKDAAGQPIAQPLADTLRAEFHARHVTKEAAVSIAQAIVKHNDGVRAEQDAVMTGKLAEEKATLAKNWGPNEAANKFVATQAAAALKVTPEEVAALEKVVGYARVMEMFRSIGTKIGEDKFVTGGSSQPGAPMTREAAADRKTELMKDTAWRDRYLAGGAAEMREMKALSQIISGDDGSRSRAA